jgi:hypothetical protein
MDIFLQCKIAVILSDLHEAWILWTDLRKILKYQISWQSAQREPSCSMRKGGQTDSHDESNNHFPQFPESVEKLVKTKILGLELLLFTAVIMHALLSKIPKLCYHKEYLCFSYNCAANQKQIPPPPPKKSIKQLFFVMPTLYFYKVETKNFNIILKNFRS